MTSKIWLKCPKCGSTNVLADALAEWDEDAQQWVLHSTYDNKSCGDCEAEFDEAIEEVIA